MKIVKKIAIVLLVVLVGMQFYRPEKNVAEGDYVAAFETETQPPTAVKQILKTACYDCHSANTKYPWYNNIAPVSYWLADHIEEGKEHLDFSDWANYDAEKKNHKLEELIEEVEEGKMPLKEYTWTHADAKLSEEQINVLVAWAKETRANY
ncbi:heme-binding domain-containing protein [Flagellimonas halotolerans]|uniref:Heme-binding domain-containing protein n=1 Tax=Flagellimonas halotolerans TaxID=3112164 RepID=A0ABU6ITW4_9FLAO|nr:MULTISPECIES: heme-binding domain-containing protein [unclassified Allomuricauda]MEC3966778.1 heme-binding domain-containing protein [Muricauda sp. SYSU M86414]MEC4266573.1 heme-binding domain-containing protein [Muricauda sp. SYSU M84420]